MHEMVRIGDLELAVIDTASSVALPQITHEGRHYVVAEPGHEFQVVTTSHAHRQISVQIANTNTRCSVHAEVQSPACASIEHRRNYIGTATPSDPPPFP